MFHLDKTGKHIRQLSTLDQDRLRSLAQALDLPHAPQPTDHDTLRHQLGRLPEGLWLVARRDDTGRPRVLATYPLAPCPQAGYRPFPNLFWLTDVALGRAVSDLERLGWLTRLQTEIAANPQQLASLAQHHAHYAQLRWRALLPEDQQLARARGWEPELAQRGIGGLCPEGTRLKCLHAHVAHELATGNPLGKRVLELIAGSGSRPGAHPICPDLAD